jgi:hypothetical protein
MEKQGLLNDEVNNKRTITEEPHFYKEYNSAESFKQTDKGKEVKKVINYLKELPNLHEHICNDSLNEAVRIVSYARIC